MVTLSVCVGSACHIKGSSKVIKSFQRLIEINNLKNEVELKGSFCLGECTEGVAVRIDEDDTIYSISESNIEEFFKVQILGRIS
ncbi:(2Fe-2S) ferredoxin domain-containing protein [Clostridium sp. JNZ J1-5]